VAHSRDKQVSSVVLPGYVAHKLSAELMGWGWRAALQAKPDSAWSAFNPACSASFTPALFWMQLVLLCR
jgi:hypothetical protein